METERAKHIISETISNIQHNSLIIKGNGCAACQVLFTLSNEMQINEQEAADLLSQILFSDPKIDLSFIEMVEKIHLKDRLMGTGFAIKNRDAKDAYIYSNFKNTLAELHSDLIKYGPDIVMRKLLMSMISLELAKNIGIDYHASTEELYYFMRKKDDETKNKLIEFMDQLYIRIGKTDGKNSD